MKEWTIHLKKGSMGVKADYPIITPSGALQMVATDEHGQMPSTVLIVAEWVSVSPSDGKAEWVR